LSNLAFKVAISEVLNPKLGVTEQVLAVHKLVIRDGSPLILLVDEVINFRFFCLKNTFKEAIAFF
jgi:hypothetical protein